jgi:serine/threonine protein kinase
MWAVGCIFYELVTRERIFDDDWKVIQYANLGEGSDKIIIGADKVPNELEHEFVSKVIKELLQVDPTRRPRATDLCEWFISGEWMV